MLFLHITRSLNFLKMLAHCLSVGVGGRPSCPDQEGRRGSEEGLPENFGVPLEGDRDVGALCGSHQGERHHEKKKKGLGPTMEGNCQVILTATIVDKLEKVKTYIRVSQL